MKTTSLETSLFANRIREAERTRITEKYGDFCDCHCGDGATIRSELSKEENVNYPSLTLDELFNLLPETITAPDDEGNKQTWRININKNDGLWNIMYTYYYYGPMESKVVTHAILAEALAKMLIKLLEEKIIKL